jgi:hypothetical protein
MGFSLLEWEYSWHPGTFCSSPNVFSLPLADGTIIGKQNRVDLC